MMIVLMIAHWYASIEENSTKNLLNVQSQLSREVQKKTQQLKQRTKELEVMNKSLEIRVKEEVRKNTEQEQMLFIQSRHTQMGEVLSMIAHQWRQPLNAIAMTNSGMQVMLRSAHYDKTQFVSNTKRIEGYVQHLSKTIDDFRNFFGQDKKKCDLTLSSIVDDAMDLIGSALEAEGIELIIKGRGDCIVHSYPNEILHALLNLLHNAKDILAKEQIKDKRIILYMFHDAKVACLEVRDYGGGIPKEILGKIFDPYFTTKEESGGTGLGLYMSKLIIEKHCQGSLQVENVENGASFKLILPIKVQ